MNRNPDSWGYYNIVLVWKVLQTPIVPIIRFFDDFWIDLLLFSGGRESSFCDFVALEQARKLMDLKLCNGS